jgi:hypothetical protein
MGGENDELHHHIGDDKGLVVGAEHCSVWVF